MFHLVKQKKRIEITSSASSLVFGFEYQDIFVGKRRSKNKPKKPQKTTFSRFAGFLRKPRLVFEGEQTKRQFRFLCAKTEKEDTPSDLIVYFLSNKT